MRGLKQEWRKDPANWNPVASFTDAWIETYGRDHPKTHCCVASFTDAWIETDRALDPENPKSSHLLQMRGLKRGSFGLTGNDQLVASFTDAWIETVKLSEILVITTVASFTDAWIETSC